MLCFGLPQSSNASERSESNPALSAHQSARIDHLVGILRAVEEELGIPRKMADQNIASIRTAEIWAADYRSSVLGDDASVRQGVQEFKQRLLR